MKKSQSREVDASDSKARPSDACPLCGSSLDIQVKITTCRVDTVTRGRYIDATMWLKCFGPRFEKAGSGPAECGYKERLHFSKNEVPLDRVDDMNEAVKFLFSVLPKEPWDKAKVTTGKKWG